MRLLNKCSPRDASQSHLSLRKILGRYLLGNHMPMAHIRTQRIANSSSICPRKLRVAWKYVEPIPVENVHRVSLSKTIQACSKRPIQVFPLLRKQRASNNICTHVNISGSSKACQEFRLMKNDLLH